MRIGIHEIQPGARVTIRTNQGQLRTGVVNRLLMYPSHVVLNMGGAYGSPAVATAANIVKVVNPRPSQPTKE